MNTIRQPLIPITDAGDDRVAEFRDIRERDLVGRQGLFIAEGRVVLRMLARSSHFTAQKILLLENRVTGMADVLSEFAADIPVMVCNADVMDSIAGFPMHRGVLAVGRAHAAPDFRKAVANLPEDALVLACNAISNHDNLGSLFRNAAAFSADLVCLDGQCCDPLYRKSIRVSVGAALTVPYVRGGDIGEMIDVLDNSGFDILALSPEGKVSILDIETRGRKALLVGTEGEGLPKSLMDRTGSVRIPQSSDFDSLNVATAAAIAMFCLKGRGDRVG
ncbi:RNA methyltransferase [Hoeflea sp. WL0058]|uniref:RNA methyltransferase n=1 Tax=Flavimaribacter sediminis TaxID=2865987 RepID=A0AAE3D0X8_9HYPH|nr:RNA methyltransferase [Flavimaribacter sediminis]MBW8639020.1 RNA methyltransferase [Flavimaribacter sediminis]